MIASVIFFKLRNTIRPEPIIEPAGLETLAMVMPCYNETFEECTRSLDSLVGQNGIEEHKRGIIVICDGRVRGPGMAKTTAEYLLEDIFSPGCVRRWKIADAYTAWDGSTMSVEVSKGSYKGVPYFCIVKDRNQGKRDSLIVVRSFLHKYNIRNTNPVTIFSRRLLDPLTDWLKTDVGVDRVDHLIGMDADTVFDADCIRHLLKESKYPDTVGVCGYVAVDFSQGGNWNVWSLYQNAEYTIAQGLRRLHQSIATKKVSCLPGCCQLLRVCETTCGDLVLVQLFGYHPKPTDGMLKQIRATASEDRNHVCLMLTNFPRARTRQALRAKALTDVPHSWSVFLSQRRRWTLGATSNDLLLVTARHCQWWERILAASNVLCWCLNIFIVAAIACMVVAFMTQPWFIIMAFAGVMLVPLTYYVIIATWLPRTARERVQYLLGLLAFVLLGPFLNITIMLFAVANMDSFGWGKTRLVVPDDVKEDMKEKQPVAGVTPPSGSSTSVTRDGADDEEASVGIARPQPAHAAGRTSPGQQQQRVI